MRSDRLMDSELWDGKAPGTETNPDWAWPASSSGSAWPQANTLSQPAASWAEPGPAPVAQPDWLGPHQTRPWENLDPAAPWPVVFGPASRVLWASLSDRITALVIDAVIAGAGFGLVAVVEGIYGPGTDQTTSAALAWVLFVAFYQPLCWWTFRGTIGRDCGTWKSFGRRMGAGSACSGCWCAMSSASPSSGRSLVWSSPPSVP